MKPLRRVIGELSGGPIRDRLFDLYGPALIDFQADRYRKLLESHAERFGVTEAALFSSPGRIEIGGNHTDHNLGKVLAAGVDLDTLGAATPRNDLLVRLRPEGWKPVDIDLAATEPRPGEKETSAALIRGIAANLAGRGFAIGGFDLSVTSRVLPGSGLSSSASFEILVASIFSGLFNNGSIPLTTLALAGQYAENEYYGKPCGLMDQMACAHGGVVALDFRNPEDPELTRLSVNFGDMGYCLMVTDTGAGHADLSDQYAAIPEEMRKVAGLFGKKNCREIGMEELLSESARIRGTLGDRAFLRAFHFLEENERVEEQVRALENGNIPEFLDLVSTSGKSSFQYLQNISVPGDPRHQSVAVALAMSEKILEGTGASRVHGGGFAGTILAFVPMDRSEGYTEFMNRIFGKDAVMRLAVRNSPAGRVDT